MREFEIFLECLFTRSNVLVRPYVVEGDRGAARGVVNSSYVGIFGEVGEAKCPLGEQRRGCKWVWSFLGVGDGFCADEMLSIRTFVSEELDGGSVRLTVQDQDREL